MSFVPTAWVPYPRPPPSVELRNGILYSGCQCLKRDGLQHDCPRTGCQGRAPCMAFPAPMCAPSGHVQHDINIPAGPHCPEGRRDRARAPKVGGTSQTRHAAVQNDKYLRMGRCGYKENPPVKHRKVPCQEHRKERV